MINIQLFFTKLVERLKTHPLIFFFAASFTILFVLLFITSLFSPKQQNSQGTPIPTNSYPTISPKADNLIVSVTPFIEQPDENFESAWQYSPFSEKDFSEFSYDKNVRSDGITTYTFPSENPKRPNIMVVKNSVTILQRTLMFDLTLDDIMLPFGKPDYIADGSRFWGNDASIYIFFQRGLAFTANKKTKKIYEQLEFLPVPPNEFKKTYGEDIIGELKKY